MIHQPYLKIDEMMKVLIFYELYFLYIFFPIYKTVYNS